MKRFGKFFAVLLCAILVLPSFASAVAVEDIDEAAKAEHDAVITEEIEFKIAGASAATSTKAIVIIPGVGGSRLTSGGEIVWVSDETAKLNKLACSESGASQYTVSAMGHEDGVYGPYDTYGFLYRRLSTVFSDEYDVIFFPYDWRSSNATTATKLATALSGYSEVVIVAHSMGGLVASKYLMTASNRSKVDKLITIGTPYQGTPHLIYVAETGDFAFALSALGASTTIKNLVQNFHATYQLAPSAKYTDGYVKYGSTEYTKAESDNFIYTTRPWALASSGSTKTMRSAAINFHNSLNVSNTTTHIVSSGLVDSHLIIGTGKDTIKQVYYNSTGFVGQAYANTGDGTVMYKSAVNNIAYDRMKTFNATHTGLVSNGDVVAYIVNLISGTTSYSSFETEEEIQVNDKGWLIGEDGRRVSVILDADADAELLDETGEPMERIGNTLYRSDGTEAGTVWMRGNNEIEYFMRAGAFTIQADEASAVNRDLTVRYLNSGYYVYGEDYTQLPEAEIAVEIADFADRQVEVTAVSPMARSAPSPIAPTHVLTEAELAELNA